MNTAGPQASTRATNRCLVINHVTAWNAGRHRAVLLLCALLVALGGWRTQAMAQAASSNDVSGVYALVTVNGLKLPATISHEGASLQVRSGSFTINADGTCSSRMTFVPPSGVESTVNTTATYTREGPKLDMQWQGAGRTAGKIEGKTFTMENEGMVFVYQWASDIGASSAKIGVVEAAKHYNETLTVTGQVAQVTFRPTVVFLNLDKPYPNSPFMGVIFSRSTNGFGDLSRLKGKDVEIKGTIREYQGKAEIILDETNQLKVVERP